MNIKEENRVDQLNDKEIQNVDNECNSKRQIVKKALKKGEEKALQIYIRFFMLNKKDIN